MKSKLQALTVHEALQGLAAGDFTSVQLTEACLAQIEAVDGQIRAFLQVTAEQALAQAEAADRRRAAGETAPLLGIPLAIKDVLATRGVETTCGSRILQGFVPPYSATAVRRLEEAGMVMLGKTNTDEFAMGSSTENSGYFPTRNPWDPERVPGGSSGGSAAAVAAQEALAALGTDTGGSVRQPASLCGVVGLKPSYGRVSRYGLVAYASSLDQIGTLTRDVEDAALLLNVIAGHDPLDSTSMPAPVPDYTAALTGDIRGLRIGLPAEYFVEGMQPAVEAAVRAAVEELARLGAEIVPIHLPNTDKALPVYYLVAPAEASANLARYDGVRFGFSAGAESMLENFRQTRGQGFGPEVKRRIMLGTYALSAGYYDAYYLKAQQVRTLIKRDFEEAFQQVDVIAGPVSPTTAFRIGEKVENPIEMYLSDIFTISVNLAGICGISVPCGFDEQGLPIGLQLIGPYLGEERILRVAHAYQQATDWHTRRPALAAL
ncbi:Asp-tRNA(Asn)/Glu-tRNA(Gln) amidotransferase subunit GatA [Litorilinea aerophila]|uniref:Glutamyl-tRNA(Gln) amidotransferase subunit A n=1 Tax=Litorilinea aerophila TaxID=1204385 RepID=A0A540V8C5_9CHLR|nr:Asp-tRNA(Asn)/Glu-tRNA(Gln) amidotransferase subunit GatA [Litorilinea aerophila]MCC9079029.1 Asp-tRNA(Asn)/Glu-tRNA(Gln) amidotransferase subunit GatA [Litorilinea aerophila]